MNLETISHLRKYYLSATKPAKNILSKIIPSENSKNVNFDIIILICYLKIYLFSVPKWRISTFNTEWNSFTSLGS